MSDQLAATNLSVLNNPDQSNLVRLPQDIFKKASAYFDKKEVKKINLAYCVALEAHEGQLRSCTLESSLGPTATRTNCNRRSKRLRVARRVVHRPARYHVCPDAIFGGVELSARSELSLFSGVGAGAGAR